MRLRRNHLSRVVFVVCIVLLQACTQYIVAAKPPGEVLAASPHVVRVTTNEGRTVELLKPQLRNGYVVEVHRDSVKMSDVKQIEVTKVDPVKTGLLVALVVGLSLLLKAETAGSQLPDDPSPIVPVALIPWP